MPIDPKQVNGRRMTDDNGIKHGRRATDDLHTRLCIVEFSITNLEKDIFDHKTMTERMCKTLDDIKIEISSARGFIKALTIGSSVAISILIGLMAINWLRFPSP